MSEPNLKVKRSGAATGSDVAPPDRGLPLSPQAPLRGTQSFVAVMAATWRRPGLTAMEVLWRWIVGIPLLWVSVRTVALALRAHPLNTAAIDAMTVFQPTAAADTLRGQVAPLLPPLRAAAVWLLPVGVAAWVGVSTAGRLAIWRRLDGALPLRPGAVGLLGLLRVLLLLLFVWTWVKGIGAAARYSLSAAVNTAADANLVLFAAMVVGLTLVLFLSWSCVVWPLDAAPLFALAKGQSVGASLRSAVASRQLRSRLVEINLVMGIVKVGLTVLAMVFSATPLPFAAEETQGFLIGWWSFVGIVFLIALDFFHVVRRAAHLSFFRTLDRPETYDLG